MRNFSISFTVVNPDDLIYEVYSIETLDGMRVSKGDLPEMMGLDKWEDTEWDNALPQEWLNHFVEVSKIPYDLVASTTFWVYHPKATHGVPISGCSEVDRYLGTRDGLHRIMKK